jgi:hypothetical protein
LSEADYKQITAAFAAIIDETIGALEKRSRPDAAAGKALDLHNLYERASLLGAEKAVSILDRIADPGCGAGTHARDIEYGRLISELKQLQRALRP